MWRPLDPSLKYTIHRQVLGDDPSNIDNRLNLWDYIVSVAKTENFIQDAENGVRVENSKLKLGGFLTEDTVINGNIREFNLSLLALKGFSVQSNQFNILSPLTVVTSGTNGVSGIKFTNINSSTTPTTGQPLGVDANGNIVVVNFSSATCDDVQLYINTTLYESITSGDDFFLEVVKNGSTYTDWTYSGGTLTLAPTSCDPVTININSILFDTVNSGDTLNIPVLTTEDNPIGSIVSNEIIIPNTNVSVNGTVLASVEAGSTVPGKVIDERNNEIGAHKVAHEWLIRDADLLLNGAVVDEIHPETNKALTTTLDGISVAATYSAGVIAVNNPAKSGYCGLPLDVPSQIGTVVNTADVAAAFAAGAFDMAIPEGYIGFNKLDLSDPTGTTLLHNNGLGSKNRFTDLGGTANSYTLVDWLDGTGTTRQAKCMIDHLFGIKGVCLLLTGDAGRWGVEWPSRLQGATYAGKSIYPVSRGMFESLIRFDATYPNQLEALMGHAGYIYSGEVPASALTSVYTMTGISLLASGRSSYYKILLFHQIQ